MDELWFTLDALSSYSLREAGPEFPYARRRVVNAIGAPGQSFQFFPAKETATSGTTQGGPQRRGGRVRRSRSPLVGLRKIKFLVGVADMGFGQVGPHRAAESGRKKVGGMPPGTPAL